MIHFGLIKGALNFGINQAFTWTRTVTRQIDPANAHQHGMAVGFNEEGGYIAVGLAGLSTGGLAYGTDRVGPCRSLDC